MAGNGVALLQVSPFTLAGVDTTQRSTIVEGTILALEGSVATLTIVAGGSNWAVGDQFVVAGGTGVIGKVATLTGSAAATVTLVSPGYGAVAATAAATTAVAPSGGTGLTITTTVNTNGGQIISITGWSITSNVATFTAINSLTGGGGQVITVSGFTGAFTFLNGTFTTNSATSTTILVPLTHANGSGSQSGIAVVQGTYASGGIPINYGFIDSIDGRPDPVGTIGPVAVPKWIEVHNIVGSGFNYSVNSTVTPNLLLIFNGVTQVSDAATITADTVAFRAEFVKNAF